MSVQSCFVMVVNFSPPPAQSPSSMMTSGVNENPNLMDNWDDAEGYYRKPHTHTHTHTHTHITPVSCDCHVTCRDAYRGAAGPALHGVRLHWAGRVQQRGAGT